MAIRSFCGMNYVGILKNIAGKRTCLYFNKNRDAMKKVVALILTSAFSLFAVAAQDKQPSKWKGEGTAAVNMTQVSLSNWAAGGDNSIAFDLHFNYTLDYKYKKSLWQNRLELSYGLNDTKSDGTRKINDKIYLSSNYGYNIGKNWYASMLMTFQSQFDKGYDYKITPHMSISKFLAPGYLTIGPGFSWTPKDWFKLNLSPATLRITFVLDDDLSNAGAYGVDPGKNLLIQFGGDVMMELMDDCMSFPKLLVRVRRYRHCILRYLDENWEPQEMCMDDDMSELFGKFSDMIKDGNIPDEMKNILSSISSNNSENNNSSSSSDSQTSSIDFETLLKMKSIMEKLNSNSNDPRANLLLSLKPYLKESRREKVDQYIKFFGMSKVLEMFNNSGGDSKK